MAKGMQQKKATKKKPAKTMMEKRAEKVQRRAADSISCVRHRRPTMATLACVTGRAWYTAPFR